MLLFYILQITLTNAAYFSKTYYHALFQDQWHYCCFHLTSSCICHVVITDWKK